MVTHVNNALLHFNALVEQGFNFRNRHLDYKICRKAVFLMKSGKLEGVGMSSLERLAELRDVTIGQLFCRPDSIVAINHTEDDVRNFSPNIKAAIANAGYTQESFAVDVGVTSLAVNSWCNNNVLPKPLTLQNVAEVLHMEVADLFAPQNGGLNEREA